MQRALLFIFLLKAICLSGNNIITTNTTLTLDAPAAGSGLVAFDLSWENSWRSDDGNGRNNWDAAWIFVKYRINGGDWQHMDLSALGNVPANATAEVKQGKGVMVYRSATGAGTVTFPDLELIWDYTTSGLQPLDEVDIKVFSIEMVHIPEGSYALGNNAQNNGDKSTWSFELGDNRGISYPVTSEDAIVVSNTNLSYSTNSGDRLGPVPAAYPKGFLAYYIMKYEMSQGQWVAFFNTLTPPQKTARDVTASTNGKNSDNVVVRNGVSWAGGEATTTLPNVAMNYLSHADGLAYLDWAALRPMTEFEFEKASIGPVSRAPDRFPWNSEAIKTDGAYALANAGTANETVTAASFSTSANGNHGGDADNKNPTVNSTNNNQGPFRVGIFAASTSNPSKAQSGASFYGVMEMAGNLLEGAIGVGTEGGRAFTGLLGDGALASDGSANVTAWPSANKVVVHRGGSFNDDWTYGMVDDRTGSRKSDARVITERRQNFQMRGVIR